MGMKMEHHQKDKDGKVIEHDDEEIKKQHVVGLQVLLVGNNCFKRCE